MQILTTMELSHMTKKIPLNDDEYVVLIDTTGDKSLQAKYGMRNIFRINSSNEILWQVNAINSVEKDTFMYVDFDSDGDLSADTFFGLEYLIDVKTGVAKRIGWHK